MKKSLSIAYSMKKKGKCYGGKMAEGGETEVTPDSNTQSKSSAGQQISDSFKSMGKKFAQGGQVKEEKGIPGGKVDAKHEKDEDASGFMKHEGNKQRPSGPAMSEAGKKLNQSPVDMHSETSLAEEEGVDSMMDKESEDLSGLDRFAMGGELAGHVSNNKYQDDAQGLVDRIMHKRSQDMSALDRLANGGMAGYSEGGKVANDTGNGQEADADPNQFDDLVLRDDLSSSYGDDDNAGDDLGNKQEDEDRKDIVARIMASRRKKDRLPSPA